MHILADIGGTKMRIAGSRDLESFTDPSIFDTPHEYDEGLAKFIEVARSIAAGEMIERIVIGITGIISPEHRATLSTPHLKWEGRSLSGDLEAALGGSAYLENDTAQVALGEAVFGAGKGADICAYVTVSTGVNGARVLGGMIDRSVRGFEIGCQYLSFDPPQTLEDLVSGAALEKKYGKHPRDLGKDWPGWADIAKILSFGLHNSIAHWSPDRLVLGGSMFNEVGISIDAVRENLERINTKYPSLPEIVHATLGDLGGLWGGLARLKQLR